MKKIIPIVFLVLACTLQAQNDERQYVVSLGDMAPDFEMQLCDGATVRLSSLRGKIVMLQFTASWCGVCRREMPQIEKQIWRAYNNNPDFVLLGIDREEPCDTIEMFRQITGVTYRIGLDPEAKIFELYAEKDAGITRNVVIDRDGRIVVLTRLFNPAEFESMVATIDKLLKNK
jgi:peroxiredoxin